MVPGQASAPGLWPIVLLKSGVGTLRATLTGRAILRSCRRVARGGSSQPAFAALSFILRRPDQGPAGVLRFASPITTAILTANSALSRLRKPRRFLQSPARSCIAFACLTTRQLQKLERGGDPIGERGPIARNIRRASSSNSKFSTTDLRPPTYTGQPCAHRGWSPRIVTARNHGKIEFEAL